MVSSFIKSGKKKQKIERKVWRRKNAKEREGGEKERSTSRRERHLLFFLLLFFLTFSFSLNFFFPFLLSPKLPLMLHPLSTNILPPYLLILSSHSSSSSYNSVFYLLLHRILCSICFSVGFCVLTTPSFSFLISFMILEEREQDFIPDDDANNGDELDAGHSVFFPPSIFLISIFCKRQDEGEEK